MIRLGIILIIIFVCCGKARSPIPHDDFVQLMVDVHMAEALIHSHHPVKLRDSFYTVYMAEVLENHKLNKSEFELALDVMLSDPEYLEFVYQEVVTEINRRQDELDEDKELIESQNSEDKILK